MGKNKTQGQTQSQAAIDTVATFAANLTVLDTHIAGIEQARSIAERLKGSTEVFDRYISGLQFARRILLEGDKVFEPTEPAPDIEGNTAAETAET